MDNNNWRPIQGEEPTMETSDWRTQLLLDSRPRIVNKIMDTLKKHLPFSGQDGLHELRKIAVRFEEKIYTAATSQSDYLWKFSLKMLSMETKSQNIMARSLPANTVGTSNRPPVPACSGESVLTDNNNWRMLSLETRCQNTMADSLPSNTFGASSKTPDPGNLFKHSLRGRRKKNALKRVKKSRDPKGAML